MKFIKIIALLLVAGGMLGSLNNQDLYYLIASCTCFLSTSLWILIDCYFGNRRN